MLSPECQTIYDILCAITGNSDVYKIVDADEITDKFPPNATMTKIQLSQIIRELKDREYVDIKYFTPDEYCLRVIKRIEEQVVPATENVENPPAVKQPNERQLYGSKSSEKEVKGVRAGLVFFMSFLGGIVGSGVVAAVTAILMKFVL